jgi:hypothetical protein|tara:strand:+ start:4570 stop:4911 length:342 start_codon:yes stop_codon:yes gene_type:complete
MNSFTIDETEEIESELDKFEIKDYTHYGLTVIEIVDGREYAIGTDHEVNSAWEQALNDYIDECILPELPDAYQMYFDDESWKRDAKYDGRGHALASYDSNELNKGEFVLFRIN